jgi:sensor histidine kinase YesM
MARDLDLSEARVMTPLRASADQPECSRPIAITKPDARWIEAAFLTAALWLFVIVIYLPVLIDRHAGQPWGSVAIDASTFLVSFVFGMILFSVFRAVVRWPLEPRATVLVIAVIIVSILQTAFDYLFTGWVAQHFEQSWQKLPYTLSRSYGSAFNYICVFSVNLALFQLMFSRRREVRHERQLAEARWSAQQAQLTALRYQLNPHFLFNTLNAISSMIVTGRNADAEQMTDKLSSFLRGSLSSDPTELVPLENELALIEEYLEIEAIRFGDRLEIDIPCSSAAGAVLVPSFLLQPLVENAIKYGAGPSAQPVKISVSAAIEDKNLILKVRDDGAATAQSSRPAGTGVGLANVRQRLDAVYGERALLVAEPLSPGFCVTITLPIDISPLRFPSGRP